tara:strand:- start:290 stop:604 length:315 start_codon:yes stop_codon:yes gene_type:complete
MKKPLKQELQLAETISNLAEVVNTLIDSMVDMTKEMQTLQEGQISLCNRLTEIELNEEDRHKPLVFPVIDNRRRNLTVDTPYPKPISKVKKVVANLRRLVDATT